MKPSNVSFKALNRLLLHLGFSIVSQNSTTHLIYKYNTGNELIILPKYRLTDKVSDIHLIAVRKSLSEMGIMSNDKFDNALLEAPKTRNNRGTHAIALKLAASTQFGNVASRTARGVYGSHRNKTVRKSLSTK